MALYENYSLGIKWIRIIFENYLEEKQQFQFKNSTEEIVVFPLFLNVNGQFHT